MITRFVIAAACAATAAAALWIAGADADDDRVTFPASCRDGSHHGTVRRGNIREGLCSDAATIAVMKTGKPAPNGSVITLADYCDDKVYRIVVMEKRASWGSEYPLDRRTGERELARINPAQWREADADIGGCMGCHRSQAGQDFLWSAAQMKGVS